MNCCHYYPAHIVFIAFVLFLSEKLAEAQRRFATLQNELQSSLDAQRESWANGRGLRRRKTVFALSQQERCKHRNIKDLQLAFSEFYLSLILLQNYQVDKSMLIICIFTSTSIIHSPRILLWSKYLNIRIDFVFVEPEFHWFQKDSEEAR